MESKEKIMKCKWMLKCIQDLPVPFCMYDFEKGILVEALEVLRKTLETDNEIAQNALPDLTTKREFEDIMPEYSGWKAQFEALVGGE